MKSTYFFWSLIASVLLISCNKDEGPFITTADILTETDTISFSSHIQPIFNANCTSCHNASHSKLDLQASVAYNELLNTGFSAPYVNIDNAEQSNIYLHVIGTLSLMPPAGNLLEADKNLILYWIEQGAINN